VEKDRSLGCNSKREGRVAAIRFSFVQGDSLLSSRKPDRLDGCPGVLCGELHEDEFPSEVVPKLVEIRV
jgi:hypothetical protein